MRADRLLRHAGWTLAALALAWLVAAAILVDLDNYDGYDTIVNARYLLGAAPLQADRPLLLSLLLVPVELLRRPLQFHPLEVRPHHVVMAGLHLGYLAVTYRFLVRRAAHGAVPLVAFHAAIPSVMFFRLAPFLSHDVVPGALFLTMLITAHRFCEDGGRGRLAALVALGAALVLFKTTYAICWVAVLAARLSVPTDRERRRRLALLAGAAAASAVVFWVAMGGLLERWRPEASLWIRPALQLGQHFASHQRHGGPWWIYARSLPSYGVLVTALLLPGLVLAWRRGGLVRSTAVAWATSFALLHVFRGEPRYLCFLAPLSAVLLLEPLAWLWQRRPARWATIAVLGADLALAGVEATAIASPFLRASLHKVLLEPLEQVPPGRRWIVMPWRMLGFRRPGTTPLPGSREEGLFHLGPQHIAVLYEARASMLERPDQLAHAAHKADGRILVLPSVTLWNHDPAPATYRQIVASTHRSTLPASAFAEDPSGTGQVLATGIDPRLVHASIQVGSDPRWYPLVPRPDGAARVDGLPWPLPDGAPAIRLAAFRIVRSCDQRSCQAH